MTQPGFFFEDIKPFKLKREPLRRHISRLIKNEQKRKGEISVIFCSDSWLLNMNREYLQHDYYTDIITFDYCEGEIISGDLFISIDRVKENSDELGVPFMRELYRVIFHGILHLAGYKDKTDAEELMMRGKEEFYLKGIDFDREQV